MVANQRDLRLMAFESCVCLCLKFTVSYYDLKLDSSRSLAGSAHCRTPPGPRTLREYPPLLTQRVLFSHH